MCPKEGRPLEETSHATALPIRTDISAYRGKAALVLDAHNLFHTLRREGDFNYRRCLDLFSWANLEEALVFYCLSEGEDGQKIEAHFKKLGFNSVAKPVIVRPNGRIKADCDMEIAVAAIHLVAKKKVKHLYLFSGDGDFVPLVVCLQKDFKTSVHIISVEHCTSRELKRVSNSFTPIGTDLVIIPEERRW